MTPATKHRWAQLSLRVLFVSFWTLAFVVVLYFTIGTPYRPEAGLAVFLGMLASGYYWARKTAGTQS